MIIYGNKNKPHSINKGNEVRETTLTIMDENFLMGVCHHQHVMPTSSQLANISQIYLSVQQYLNLCRSYGAL